MTTPTPKALRELVDREVSKGLNVRTLLAMHRRWEKDLARLEIAYPITDWSGSHPSLETIRNLATAIVELEMLLGTKISRGRKETLRALANQGAAE